MKLKQKNTTLGLSYEAIILIFILSFVLYDRTEEEKSYNTSFFEEVVGN